jgi:drug/metabolite transporter (DMT)-like permease
MLPLFLILRKKLPRDIGTFAKLTIYCLIYVSINTAQVVGLVQGSSGVGAVITYTQPLFVLCLAAPFLKEKITANKVLGAAVGFTGVTVLFLNKTGSFTIGSGLILFLSAFLWAVSVIYYKRLLGHVDPFVAVFLQLALGSAVFMALDLGMNSLTFPTNTQYVAIVLYSSAGGFALGNILWLHLLKDEEATTLSSSTLLVPAVALLLGWIFLKENFNFESFLGSALTLGGVCLANLSRNRSRSRNKNS